MNKPMLISGYGLNELEVNFMKTCANCVYRDLLITQEPCMDCIYGINWEGEEEKEEDDEDTQQ